MLSIDAYVAWTINLSWWVRYRRIYSDEGKVGNRIVCVAVLETPREYYTRVGLGLGDLGDRFGGWV